MRRQTVSRLTIRLQARRSSDAWRRSWVASDREILRTPDTVREIGTAAARAAADSRDYATAGNRRLHSLGNHLDPEVSDLGHDALLSGSQRSLSPGFAICSDTYRCSSV